VPTNVSESLNQQIQFDKSVSPRKVKQPEEVVAPSTGLSNLNALRNAKKLKMKQQKQAQNEL